GRYEYRDGLETVPGDPTLAALKRMRIAERLVGPFEFTHVTRSFDGVRLAWDRPAWNVTAFGTRPTRGGFEVSANRELDLTLAGAAVTLKRPPADVRLFYLYYRDGRAAVLKVDNRPLTVRTADRAPIALHTTGGHGLTVLDLGPGRLDLLGWVAVQAGDWGADDHVAWAYAVETGYQLPARPRVDGMISPRWSTCPRPCACCRSSRSAATTAMPSAVTSCARRSPVARRTMASSSSATGDDYALSITVGPAGVGPRGADSLVRNSFAIGAVYDSTGTGNCATIVPAALAANSPQKTLRSPTRAQRP